MTRYGVFGILVVFFGVVPLRGQGLVKIGIVDYPTVFNNYHKTIKANKVLQQKLAGSKARDQELVREREACVNQMQRLREAALDPKLSKKDREEIKKAYEAKSKELAELEKKLGEWRTSQNKAIQEYSQKRQLELMQEVIAAIAAEARQRDLDLVVDHQGRVLYVRNPEDLTQALLAALNPPKEEGSKTAEANPSPPSPGEPPASKAPSPQTDLLPLMPSPAPPESLQPSKNP
jgi:Skp family chaperone for outer membrane proteins